MLVSTVSGLSVLAVVVVVGLDTDGDKGAGNERDVAEHFLLKFRLFIYNGLVSRFHVIHNLVVGN